MNLDVAETCGDNRPAMLYATKSIGVQLVHGVARLRFCFPGWPANAIDGDVLSEWEQTLNAVMRSPARILVIESTHPYGFIVDWNPNCFKSLRHPADRAALAWRGQNLLRQLTEWDGCTVAVLDGACLGVGLELALACDYRIAIARPVTKIGLPNGLCCFGGSVLLRERFPRRVQQVLRDERVVSARRAAKLGLVDRCCLPAERGFYLQLLLDRLDKQPRKRPLPASWTGLAHERRQFTFWQPPLAEWDGGAGNPASSYPVVRQPVTIGILGDCPELDDLLAEALLHGHCLRLIDAPIARYRQLCQLLHRQGFLDDTERDDCLRRITAEQAAEEAVVTLLIVAANVPQAAWLRYAQSARQAVILGIQSCTGGPSALPPPGPPQVLDRFYRLYLLTPQAVAIAPLLPTIPQRLQFLRGWFSELGVQTLILPPAAQLLPQAA